jgi:hypothetical protein
MKRTTKILALLAALVLTVGAVAVFASAQVNSNPMAHKDAEVEGNFLYYDASEETYALYANSKIAAKIKALDDGDVIKLLSDVAYRGNLIVSSTDDDTLSDGKVDNVNIDLNGYQLSIDYYDDASAYLIEVGSNTVLNVYSSDSDCRATICAYALYNNPEDSNDAKNNTLKISSIFKIKSSNARIYLGDAEAAPVISTDKTINYEACDGDNINTFSSMLFTSYMSGGYNAENSSFNVGGGTHYQTTLKYSMFGIYAGVDINAEGAKFINLTGGEILNFHPSYTEKFVETIYETDENGNTVYETDENGNTVYETDADGNYVYDKNGAQIPVKIVKEMIYRYTSPADSNVNMKNCVLYTTGTAVNNIYEADANAEYGVKANSVVFENCTIAGSAVHTVSKGLPTYTNCIFSSNISGYDGACIPAKTSAELTLPAYDRVMHYDKGTWTKFWDIVKKEEDIKVYLPFRTAFPENTVSVTWQTPEGYITEKWFKDANSIPIPALYAPSNDVYTYEYSPAIKNTLESGDITYTLVPRMNFTTMANIAIHKDFTFNLYIPKEIGESALLKSARIDTLSDSSVIKGDPFKITDGTLTTLELTPGYPEQYYMITQEIFASSGDTEYKLVLLLDGAFGETITHELDFSIFNYADRVIAGNFTSEAKAMVSATKTYIKAARNHFSGTSIYPDADFAGVKDAAVGKERGELSQAMSDTFKSISVSTENKIKFIFKFETLTEDTFVSFTYPINAVSYTETVNAKEVSVHEIELNAVDLRSAIKIDLLSTGEGVDYTYRLANYVNYIETNEAYKDITSLHTLVDAMWDYSVKTRTYLTTTGSDTPAVNLSVNGEAITSENYVIVADEASANAALALKNAILAKTGHDLAIVSEAPADKNCIFISVEISKNDFLVSTDGKDLVIDCSFASFVDNAMKTFISKRISALNSSFDFGADFKDVYFTDRVYYSDFGIEGVDMDAVKELVGETNADVSKWHGDVLKTLQASGLLVDKLAELRELHAYANNARRYTVYANDEVYYLNTSAMTSSTNIIIETSVNFGNARFVLDDSTMTKASSIATFVVRPYLASHTIKNAEVLGALEKAGLNPNTTNIDLGLGYPAMLVPVNETHKTFRRRGYNQWDGKYMTELVVVDKDGNIDPTTPLMFDYSTVSSVTVYPLDMPEITINGGHMTTVVPAIGSFGSDESAQFSVSHGLSITRSNTRVEGMVHEVIGEFNNAWEQAGGKSSYYDGFYCVYDASNVTFYDCILQGRRCYGHSSYEISLKMANDVLFEKCIQSNFYVDAVTHLPVTKNTTSKILAMSADATWGAAGTNYCKNFVYLDSAISRYDAHAGLYNGAIINTDIQGVEIVGWGEFNIENSNMYCYGTGGAGNGLIHLRSDYGRTWTGTIIFKDVDAYLYETENNNYEKGNAPGSTILDSTYQNWYWGYQVHYPNLIIDGIEYYGLLAYLKDPKAKQTPLTAASRGTVQVFNTDFEGEPDLHLDHTKNTRTNRSIRDWDGDGYADNSLLFYDGKFVDGVKTATMEYTTTAGATTSFTVTVYEGLGIKMSDMPSDMDYKVGIYTDEYVNLNPIVPPESILILNNFMQYDFKSAFKSYMSLTSFFNNTLIYEEITDANGNVIKKRYINDPFNDPFNDTPILPFS